MSKVTDTPCAKKKREKKPRRRMKAVYNKIREQMEFYFSDANLHKDRFLRKEIDATKDGYIPLETFLTFKRIKQLTGDITVLVEALDKKSGLLQLNTEQTHVKRVTEISEPVNVDERTVYVECLPHHVDHDWVKRVFSPCGKVVYVSLPRYHSTGDLKGFAFIEFETIEGAQAACQELNNPPANFSHRVGMFPKSSHQLESLKKKLPEDQIKATQDKALELIESGEIMEEGAADAENTIEPNEEPSTPIDNKSELPDVSKSSKRRRTDSETHTESGNISTESGPSPTKRKKSEVTFSLPTEESSKADEDKATPGSAKKRNRKRKSRSRSSDEHLELNDSKDENEDTPVKKAKPSDGSDADNTKSDPEKKVGKEQAANDKENKTKKKRFRRKKLQKDKEVPELRVLPKKEWLGLREEYLQLQKTSMALLKKSLGDVKMSCHKEEEKDQRKEIEFVPDVIVKVTADQPMKRKQLKASLGDCVQIAYIDVKEESQDGFIRCQNAESARSICEKTLKGYSFNSVSGEEEKGYWQKLSTDRETKLNSKSRHKKRGHQKWMDKAQKASIENTESKHIVFDDD